MKSATIPPLRVTPSLRSDAESVLQDGETLSSFVEESLRKQIARRKFQQEFIARGMTARDDAKATGRYVSTAQIMDRLRAVRDEVETKQ